MSSETSLDLLVDRLLAPDPDRTWLIDQLKAEIKACREDGGLSAPGMSTPGSMGSAFIALLNLYADVTGSRLTEKAKVLQALAGFVKRSPRSKPENSPTPLEPPPSALEEGLKPEYAAGLTDDTGDS